jgi:hypothetical protein
MVFAIICCTTAHPAVWAAEPAKPATELPAAAAPDLTTVMPELNFNGNPLEDVVQFLQDAVPAFKVVVVRDPNVPADFPSIRLRLKRVTIAQVLELLPIAYPNITIAETTGSPDVIYCIKVHADATGQLRGNGNGGLFGGGIGGGAAPQPTVGIYRLSGIVASLAGKSGTPNAEKEALNQSLSLIKAALDEAGGDAPTLRVHEGTQTLIFKGTVAQQGALQKAMEALQPNEVESAKEFQKKTEDMTRALEMQKYSEDQRRHEMQNQLDRLEQMLAERDKEMLARIAEAERYKVRLEMMETKARELDQALAKKTAELDKAKNELSDDALRMSALRQRWESAKPSKPSVEGSK